MLSTTHEDERRWRAGAGRFLRACYDAAKDRLGEEEARKLFKAAVPIRKRGRRKGAGRNAGRDNDLLARYDELCAVATEQEKPYIPRQLAYDLYQEYGNDHGASPEAIEKRLRRLINKREERAAKSEREHRRLLEAYRTLTGEDLPATLLGTAKSGDSR